MGYYWDYLEKKSYNNKVGKYKFRKEFDFIVANSKDGYSKILDIAGGAGRFAIPLHTYSQEITVIDINETAIKLLKERDEGIHTVCGEFMETEFHDTFSLILCIEALGYFNNLDDFFTKVNSLLNVGGTFIFTYNNPNSWRFFLRKLKHWKKGPYQYKETTLKELKKILHKYGFKIENMEGMNWLPIPLSSNSSIVSVFENIEKKFRLNKWYSQSPWILMSITKS